MMKSFLSSECNTGAFFSSCLRPSSTAQQSAHGCFPSKVLEIAVETSPSLEKATIMPIQAPVWRIAQCPPARRKKARKARAIANRPRTTANDSFYRAVEQVKNGILKNSIERPSRMRKAHEQKFYDSDFCATRQIAPAANTVTRSGST